MAAAEPKIILWTHKSQSIIWTNAKTLLIGPLGENVSEILI